MQPLKNRATRALSLRLASVFRSASRCGNIWLDTPVRSHHEDEDDDDDDDDPLDEEDEDDDDEEPAAPRAPKFSASRAARAARVMSMPSVLFFKPSSPALAALDRRFLAQAPQQQ